MPEVFNHPVGKESRTPVAPPRPTKGIGISVQPPVQKAGGLVLFPAIGHSRPPLLGELHANFGAIDVNRCARRCSTSEAAFQLARAASQLGLFQ